MAMVAVATLVRPRTVTRPPSGVNFTALASRLSTICLSARRSALSRIPAEISTSSSKRLASARVDTTRMVSARIASRSTSSRSSRALPASILDMSRMSLITSSR